MPILNHLNRLVGNLLLSSLTTFRHLFVTGWGWGAGLAYRISCWAPPSAVASRILGEFAEGTVTGTLQSAKTEFSRRFPVGIHRRPDPRLCDALSPPIERIF